MMSLKDDLKAEAENLGFSVTGVMAPSRPPHYGVYQGWIDSGKHASMGYLATDRARERRATPELILETVRSVLVVGLRYATPPAQPESPGDEPHGRVAAYAWGLDYHDVIPPRLEALSQKLDQMTGRIHEQRSYTDTGPILERDFAQQAGLGWAGKNTCLIAPRQGSFFLLGEMLVDEPLEPDPPFISDLCGTCTRCIDACPTGCIQPDRTIDAGRCISYLTIENKGEIPLDLRPQIGDWIFGCDVCQSVCPWNIRFAPPDAPTDLEPKAERIFPALRPELRLTPHEFNQKFRNSPIQRARRRGYLRNVTVALGNARDPDSVPELLWLLTVEPEPLVRAHTAWALGQIGGPAARQGLEKALMNEGDPTVTREIRAALAL